mgnify:CR=1 FL=1
MLLWDDLQKISFLYSSFLTLLISTLTSTNIIQLYHYDFCLVLSVRATCTIQRGDME